MTKLAAADFIPVPIWLDCDTGHDDAFAILLAAWGKGSHLLGLSTVHGNSSLENTTYNSLAILEAIGCKDTPVYAGSSKPIVRPAVHAEFIHGESGLDGTTVLPKPTVPAANGDAIEAMYNALIGTSPGTAWLVATGALTNVALLFDAYPSLALHLKGISLMGGAVGKGFSHLTSGAESLGNVSPEAEFNIYCDPEAAQAVLSNPILSTKTILIPLDLTHQVIADSQIRQSLLKGSNIEERRTPTRVRQLFNEILIYFTKTYANHFGISEGPPMHDPVAVFAAIRPYLFRNNDHEHFAVLVDSFAGYTAPSRRSAGCGKTVVRKLHEHEMGIRIPTATDIDAFWDQIEYCLTAVDSEMKS